jgi:asparagine synthase (glutamine-hydrolysing)
VPFLDHEVVELASRIPATLKVGGGGKYILKQAARNFLPADIIDRPKVESCKSVLERGSSADH